jgi:hypothetical protein
VIGKAAHALVPWWAYAVAGAAIVGALVWWHHGAASSALEAAKQAGAAEVQARWDMADQLRERQAAADRARNDRQAADASAAHEAERQRLLAANRENQHALRQALRRQVVCPPSGELGDIVLPADALARVRNAAAAASAGAAADPAAAGQPGGAVRRGAAHPGRRRPPGRRDGSLAGARSSGRRVPGPAPAPGAGLAEVGQ